MFPSSDPRPQCSSSPCPGGHFARLPAGGADLPIPPFSIRRFRQRERISHPRRLPLQESLQRQTEVPEFCNGRRLRDYQVTSLHWNIRNWLQGHNCILGDEMASEIPPSCRPDSLPACLPACLPVRLSEACLTLISVSSSFVPTPPQQGLGKTAQSISVLETMRRIHGVNGPFLIVAPLTTLGHWRREIETWTEMNAVIYAGSAEDRRIIRECEFEFANG